MKKSHFLWLVIFMWFLVAFFVIFWLGLGNPRHIATKSQPIKFWWILKKSWDWVKFPTFTEIFFGGSPYPRSSEVSKTSGSAASELELSISTLEILVKVCDCQIIQLITNTVLLLQKINVSKITFPCHLPKKVSLDFSLWLMCAPFLCQEPVQLVPASGLG